MESPSRILGPFAVAPGVSRAGRTSAEARVARYGKRAAAAKSKDMMVLALFVALAGGVAPAGPGPANAGTARSPALVYVSDSENDLIDIFDRGGRQVGEITSGLSAPAGLFVDSAHDLWVANSGANDVLVFPRGATTPSAKLSDTNEPNDVALCGDGTAYVADSGGLGGVGVYPKGQSRPSRRLEPMQSGAGGVENYVTCDAAGNVFATGFIGVSPFFATTEWKGAQQSGYVLLPGSGQYLAGIRATKTSRLLIVTLDDNGADPAVVEFTEAGQPTGRAIQTGSALWAGLAIDPSANVVFGAVPSEREGLSLRFPSGRSGVGYASGNLAYPVGVAFDPGG